MPFGFFRNRRHRANSTKFINLDARKCEACWECVKACKNETLGKVDLFFHRHALIVNPDKCTGCLRCVKACKYRALTAISISAK